MEVSLSATRSRKGSGQRYFEDWWGDWEGGRVQGRDFRARRRRERVEARSRRKTASRPWGGGLVRWIDEVGT